MKTRFLVVARTIASALAMAGCKQEAKVPEPVRPVLSTVVEPAASAEHCGGWHRRTPLQDRSRLPRAGAPRSRAQSTSEIWLTRDRPSPQSIPTALELAVRSARAELSKAQAQLANANRNGGTETDADRD